MELQPDSWWKLWGNKLMVLSLTKIFKLSKTITKIMVMQKPSDKTDVQLNEEHTKADVTIDVSEGENTI